MRYVAFAALLCVTACSSPDGKANITVTGPDPSQFAAAVGGVGAVFARRCGSLDCHGALARPMRIYSANGLRLEGTGFGPGGSPITSEEMTANYLSVVSVEPEKTTLVATKGADPYTLLILKKPLELERHKGGPALVREDDAEKCISSWLKGTIDRNACTTAAQLP